MSGLHYSNFVSGISGYVPSEMAQNGWKFYDRSKHDGTIWQYMRTLENGRRDEIRFNNHKDYGERTHYHIKIMVGEQEKPTKERFMHEIAPHINISIKRILKGGETNVKTSNDFETAFPYRIKMMTFCSHCAFIVELTPSKTCPVCGKSLG